MLLAAFSFSAPPLPSVSPPYPQSAPP